MVREIPSSALASIGAAAAALSGGFATGIAVAASDVRGSGATPAGLSPEQTRNAAVIVAVGQRMKIPARGWVIAVATALQESDLINLGDLGPHNDTVYAPIQIDNFGSLDAMYGIKYTTTTTHAQNLAPALDLDPAVRPRVAARAFAHRQLVLDDPGEVPGDDPGGPLAPHHASPTTTAACTERPTSCTRTIAAPWARAQVAVASDASRRSPAGAPPLSGPRKPLRLVPTKTG